MSQTLKLFFDKINNIDKHLTRLTIGNRDGIQIIKNRKETGDITKEIEEIKKIIRMYFKSLYSIHQGYQDEMDNILDRYKISKINRNQRDHLKNPTTPKVIEVVIEILPIKKKRKGKERTGLIGF